MKFHTWAEFLEHQRSLLTSIEVAIECDILDNHATVYPPRAGRLRFTETPLADVKVVILGQDPYHQPGQADGLAFSVRDDGIKPLPPSLKNILREFDDDLSVGTSHFKVNGDLTPWTRQGVLLLNTALTVRRDESGSHCDIWQPFTDEVIRAVCDSAAVAPHFILWGSKAKDALARACYRKLLIALPDDNGITFTGSRGRRMSFTHSAHPSPLSANKGFFGSRPFSRANLALTLNNPGCTPVDWRLS